MFAVAGFWQRTAKGKGFAMVTCNPNDLVAPIHPKAMITILHSDDHETWLRGRLENILLLQRPYPATEDDDARAGVSDSGTGAKQVNYGFYGTRRAVRHDQR